MSIEDVAIKIKRVSSTRAAAVIGILAAVGGPFAIIAFGGSEESNLPWYIWAIASVVLLLVISAGYYLFTRTHDAQDISIRPKPR
jgi:drug/metabolite transporter (DMT)-like permease